MTPIVFAAGGLPDESAYVAAASAVALDVVRRPLDAAELLAVAAADPRIAIVISADVPRLTADLVRRLCADDRLVIGLAAIDAHEHLRSWGVRAVIAPAAPDVTMQQIATAVHAQASGVWTPQPATPAAREPARVDGRVIAVWGPHGAPGRTTTAIALATSLAASGRRTCLVDADTHAPGVALALGVLDEVSGLIVACRQAELGSLQPASVRGCCRDLGHGLAVLTGVPEAARWPDVRQQPLERVWQALREAFDVVVIDVGASAEAVSAVATPGGSAMLATSRDTAALTALAAADAVLAVGRSSTVGVARLLQGLDEVDAATTAPMLGALTAQRAGDAKQARRAVRQATGLECVALVADERSLERAQRRGRTSRGTRHRRAVNALAQRLLDEAGPRQGEGSTTTRSSWSKKR